MKPPKPARRPVTTAAAAGDPELADRVAAGDPLAFESLMRKYNGRLFRIARAMLDEGHAPDPVAEARGLTQFQ